MDEDRVLGVARLSKYLKRLIEEAPGMKELSVRGEISNRRVQPTSGHCYFVLKERNAILNCIVFARDVPYLPPLREGASVVARGTLTTYEAQGRYQLWTQAVRLEGEGSLFAAFELLRAQLAAEGLFALERKRALPAFPFMVALVSSPTAEGAVDFFTVAGQRSPHIRVQLFATSVQGEQAPAQIVAAIREAGGSGADLVVIVRGGGSFEDLFAFSHESVVRAIRACPLPVLTGIGHESDITLADHAADSRASTPTDAATRLPLLRDLRERVKRQRGELRLRANRGIGGRRERVARLERRLEQRSPQARLQERGHVLSQMRFRLLTAMERRGVERRRLREQLEERILSGVRRALELRERAVALAKTALLGRDPHRLLELGYAIVRIDGKIVKDVADARPGMLLTARLAYGTVRARVEETAHDERERSGDL